MPLPASDRIEHLETIKKDKSRHKGKVQISYQDDPKFMVDVYMIELDFLIFNQFNDRIAVEVKTEEAMSPGGEIPAYTDALEKKIMDYLWELNIQRNKETMADLDIKGQIEPGIVTADGVIVNGNRRAMLLKRGNKTYFKAGILPDKFDGHINEIRKLETELQFNVDKQLEYEPLAKYIKVKELKEANIDFPEIAKLMNQKEPEVRKWHGIMELMDEYLDSIGSPGVYTLLRLSNKSGSKEEAFIQAYTQLSQIASSKVKVDWPYDPIKDARKYKQIMFDYIRSESIDSPTQYRLIGAQGKHGGSNGNGIFADKELFEQMYEKHKKIVDEVTMNLADLQEYREKPECAHIKDSLHDLSQMREADWRAVVQQKMDDNLKEFTGKRASKVEKFAPAIRLDRALTELKGISSTDIDDGAFTEDEVCINQVREISKIIEQLKRSMGQ